MRFYPLKPHRFETELYEALRDINVYLKQYLHFHLLGRQFFTLYMKVILIQRTAFVVLEDSWNLKGIAFLR